MAVAILRFLEDKFGAAYGQGCSLSDDFRRWLNASSDARPETFFLVVISDALNGFQIAILPR